MSIVSVTLVAASLYYTNQFNRETSDANRQQLEQGRQGQITDQFAKAVEQLGSDKLDVRLGAIYALERVMRDSRSDHLAVVEILTAYIRQRVPSTSSAESPSRSRRPSTPSTAPRIGLPLDITATMTVLGRRNSARDQSRDSANLSNLVLAGSDLRRVNVSGIALIETDLTGADLNRAKLKGADLSGANLDFADLDLADLHVANLSNADLRDAQLVRADLRRSDLTGADLRGADLRGADLRGASLWLANLNGANLGVANLNGADLSGADLRGTHLRGAKGLTTNHFRSATIDAATTLPGGVFLPAVRSTR